MRRLVAAGVLAELLSRPLGTGDETLRGLAAKGLPTREMLAALPALSKTQIGLRRRRRTAEALAFSFTYQDSTSGSTGKPFQVYRSAHSIQRESIRLWHLVGYCGIDPATQPLHSVVYLSHYPQATAFEYTDHTLWPFTIFKRPFGAKPSALALPASDGSFMLGGTPSSHAAALQAAADFPSRRPRLALSSGEALPAKVRKEMLERYPCPVVNLYVMREFGLLGFECKRGEGMHLFETDFVFESSADDGLLVTDTTNSLEPYIHYVTGDQGRLRREPGGCSCGSHLPLLLDFRGRAYGKPISASSG